MYYTLKSLYNNSPIVAFNIIDDKVLLLNNQYRFLVFDTKNYDVLYQKEISTSFESRHAYDTSMSISNTQELLLTQVKSLKSHLIKFTDKLSNVATVSLHKGDISCSTFSHNAKMLTIGGEDGKAYIYSVEDKEVLRTFPRRPDYVSHISFSQDDKFISIHYFDNSNIIYSFDKGTIVHEYKSDNVVAKALFPKTNNASINITKDTKIFKYDFKEEKNIELDFSIDEWPSAILHLNEDFVILGTRSKYLYILDVSKQIIIAKLDLENIGVTSLFIDKEKLYINFIDGELRILDMANALEEFELSLKLKKFKEATQLLQKNIFLAIHPSARKYDEDWKDVLLKAKKSLAANEKKTAEDMVKPFLFDPKKEEQFLFCLGNVQDYKLLLNHIESRRYIDALVLVDEKDYLRQTKEYEALNKHFIKRIHDAKFLFAKNTPEFIVKAKALLAGYSRIPSKKVLVNNLLIRYEVFNFANRFVEKRDFRSYFLIVDQNIFLREEEIYNRMLMIGNQTLAKLYEQEQNANYVKALEIVEYLKDFIPFKEKLEKVSLLITKKQQLIKNIKNANIQELYTAVQEDENLATLPAFIEFHNIFLELREEAHTFAKEGDSLNVFKTLSKYIEIEYVAHLLAQEFKVSYLNELKNNRQGEVADTIDWEKSLQQYTHYFGMDDEILELVKEFDVGVSFPDGASEATDGYISKELLRSVIVHS